MLPLNYCPYKVSVFGLLLSVSAYPFCDPHLALSLLMLSSARFSISGILAFAFCLADSCLCFVLPFFGSVLYDGKTYLEVYSKLRREDGASGEFREG